MTEQDSQTTGGQPYKPTVRHISGTRYDVQSRTRPERTHRTDVYHLTCDCEAGQHGKRCWALALAISIDAWRRQEGKKARQAAGVQAANWSSAPAAVTQPATAPVTRPAETGMRALQECFE